MSYKNSLAGIANWDYRTASSFRKLILKYQETPSTKHLISSMIKFEDMYRPLRANPFRSDRFIDIDGINEYRRFQRARAYLYKKDLIKTISKKGGKRIILTSRGRKIFYEEYPLAKLREQKWDGKWTIVTYDFPKSHNKDRDYFRKKLKELGFGSPQESLYISPLPLTQPLLEMIEGERFKDFVWVVTAKRVLGLGNKEVGEKSWKLVILNDLYRKLLDTLPRVKEINEPKLKDSWKLHFLALDNVDPYLPFELLPKDWRGETCREEFKKTDQFSLPSLLRAIFH